jgi:transcription elongation factor SPT6
LIIINVFYCSFWQLSEELTGNPPGLEENSRREEESVWIHNQLTGDGFLSFFGNERVNKEIEQTDIVNVLYMLHVNKFEVRFILLCNFLSLIC